MSVSSRFTGIADCRLHSSVSVKMALLLRLARLGRAPVAWPRSTPTARWLRPLYHTLPLPSSPALRAPASPLTLTPQSSVLACWSRAARSNRGPAATGAREGAGKSARSSAPRGGGAGNSGRDALFKELRKSRRRDDVLRRIEELRPFREVKE